MRREIVINAGNHETRIAILEEKDLVEVMVERPESQRRVGDIYKGRVNAVLPGMQAAFVDLGLEKTAFLHASDLHPSETDLDEMFEDEDAEDAKPEAGGGGGRGRWRRDEPTALGSVMHMTLSVVFLWCIWFILAERLCPPIRIRISIFERRALLAETDLSRSSA